jgi:alpha-tubulin suppressor-like RCC1 family protein
LNTGLIANTWAYTAMNVKGLAKATQVAAGSDTSCAVMSDATVWCWGARGHALMGSDSEPVSSFVDRITPTKVPLLSGIERVALAPSYACATTITHGALCWGNLMIASEPTPYKTVWPPEGVDGVACVSEVVTGDTTACLVACDGTVSCWGSNASGLLGTGAADTDGHPKPQIIALDEPAAHIAVGPFVACAITRTGSLRCWGRNVAALLDSTRAQSDVFAPKEISWSGSSR